MISVQVESFEQCAEELAKLFPMHHRELGLFKDRMPLAPDWHEYNRRERAGLLFMVTVRRDGAIAAYYIAQTLTGFHYKETLTGTMDIAYVVPEQRNKGLALPLFRHVEQELRRRGVKVWYSGCKTGNPMGMPMLHALLGFVPADSYFVKWIGGAT